MSTLPQSYHHRELVCATGFGQIPPLTAMAWPVITLMGERTSTERERDIERKKERKKERKIERKKERKTEIKEERKKEKLTARRKQRYKESERAV